MESVFIETGRVHPKNGGIGFVFGKQKLRIRSRAEAVSAQLLVFCHDVAVILKAQTWLGTIAASPAPRISKPKVCQQIKISSIGTTVEYGDTDQCVKL